ncbi:MAG TPA: EpsD family peptidyl-prolyl cis-trans isomerase [Sulfuriferula sp.]|nr:EpsD family peptidyl-prolyl cis-trans isomerase [Sulfuriferula sp.]
MKSHPVMHKMALMLILGAVLAGCSKQDTKSSAIARVNGIPITSAQLDLALSHLNLAAQNLTPQAKNQVVQALVDQQLLVQKATAQKLDQDPAVQQLLQAAHDQVLSQAYLQRAGQAVAKPTEAEISDYYNQHPELFSQRRIYSLQELAIAAPKDRIAELNSRLETSHDLGGFVNWLRSQNIPFRTGSEVKAAEQLPMNILPRMQTMQNGQLLALPSANGITVLQIASIQSAPITLGKAHTLIERYLTATKQRDVATADIKKLRDAAKIEYMGEFASLGKTAQSKSDNSTAGLPEIK